MPSMGEHSLQECELCNKLRAKVVCESDKANLCWVCDVKVHSANFIVARHVRKLLCHVCQSPTEWQASGGRPSPTLSLCNKCFTTKHLARKHENHHQVVPFSPSLQATASASSSSGENDGDARGQHQRDGNGNSARKHQLDGNDNQVVPFTPSSQAAASASSRTGGNAGDAHRQRRGA